MSSRIALIVSMLMFVVGCDKMGSSGSAVRAHSDDAGPESAVVHYFIRLNPDYSDSLAEVSKEPVWRAEIIEIESDSIPATPDSFVTTDTAEIHSLGLQTPTEARDGATTKWEDWHDDGGNRQWTSWLIPAYVWRNGVQKRTMTVASATYRPHVWGYVAVRGETYRNGSLYWNPGWKSSWPWPSNSIVIGKTWEYPLTYPWTWDQYGTHSWGSGAYGYSHICGVW